MKVIIVGAGHIGYKLAYTLSIQGLNDVIILDSDKQVLDEVDEKLDVLCINKSGTDIKELSQVHGGNTNLFIAVTPHFETNLLSCSIIKKLSPKTKTICLGSQSTNYEEYISLKSLGVDYFFLKELECAQQILNLIITPQLSEKVFFDNIGEKKVSVVSIPILPGVDIVGTQIRVLEENYFKNIKICFIWRNDEIIFPNGKTRINNYDEIYITGYEKDLNIIVEKLTLSDISINKVVIIGVDDLALHIIKLLKKNGLDYKVQIIEENKEKAQKFIIDKNLNIPVLSGDINQGILEETLLDRRTLVISNLEESGPNILTSMLVKRLGAGYTYAISHELEYREVISSIPSINSCFSNMVSTLNSILSIDLENFPLRGGRFFQRVGLESILIKIGPKSTVLNKTLKEINMPEKTLIALIYRENKLIIPTNKAKINLQENDKLVVFCYPNQSKQVHNLLLRKNNIF